MPRYTNGDSVVETSNAVEGVRLRAQGYTEAVARTAAVRAEDGLRPPRKAKKASAPTPTAQPAPAEQPAEPE